MSKLRSFLKGFVDGFTLNELPFVRYGAEPHVSVSNQCGDLVDVTVKREHGSVNVMITRKAGKPIASWIGRRDDHARRGKPMDPIVVRLRDR